MRKAVLDRGDGGGCQRFVGAIAKEEHCDESQAQDERCAKYRQEPCATRIGSFAGLRCEVYARRKRNFDGRGQFVCAELEALWARRLRHAMVGEHVVSGGTAVGAAGGTLNSQAKEARGWFDIERVFLSASGEDF